jgi:hypothetical protein
MCDPEPCLRTERNQHGAVDAGQVSGGVDALNKNDTGSKSNQGTVRITSLLYDSFFVYTTLALHKK